MSLIDDKISQYSILSDGTLHFISSISTGGTFPLGMQFDPSGRFAYVADLAESKLSQFSVGSDGSLSPLTPASVSLATCPAGPMGFAETSTGTFVYVLSCGSSIEAFWVSSDGTLTATATTELGSRPQGMFISNSNVYVTDTVDATVSMFSIRADGSLNPLSQPTVNAGSSPANVALDASGKFAYVTDFPSSTVLQYSVGADGGLAPLVASSVSTGAVPTQILINGGD